MVASDLAKKKVKIEHISEMEPVLNLSKIQGYLVTMWIASPKVVISSIVLRLASVIRLLGGSNYL